MLGAMLYKDLNDMYSELQESHTDDLVPSKSVGHASIEDQCRSILTQKRIRRQSRCA